MSISSYVDDLLSINIHKPPTPTQFQQTSTTATITWTTNWKRRDADTIESSKKPPPAYATNNITSNASSNPTVELF